MINIYESVEANKRKSILVIIAFIIFIALAIYFISQALSIYFGYQPGGIGSIGIALIISGLMSLGGYFYGDKIILGISQAHPASRKDDFDFYTVSENLSIAAGIPKPKLYVIDDTAPNAFATGRDPQHAVICATKGLLKKLNRTELEGVIAHEISHIKNFDSRLMSIVSVLVGTAALLGDWLLRARWLGNRDDNKDNNQLGIMMMVIGIIFAVLSPIIAQLIQLALSRRREFLADAGSVFITKQPNGLMSALQKLSEDKEALEVANKATAHLYIINPFKGKTKSIVSTFSDLFNTHPSIEMRIKALQAMS